MSPRLYVLSLLLILFAPVESATPIGFNLTRCCAVSIAAAGTVAVASTALAPVALSALGFGAAGPTAGSIAAAWQSSLGLVEAGSTFAMLQSIGMTGFSGTVITVSSLSVSGAAIAAAGRFCDEIESTGVCEQIEKISEDSLASLDQILREKLASARVASLRSLAPESLGYLLSALRKGIPNLGFGQAQIQVS